jgi:hypothetical protein
MVNKPRAWSLPLGCHDQSTKGQLRAHVIAHGPTHHLPGRQIQHRGEIQPSLARGNVGHVGQPHAVGYRGRELLLEQVGRNRQLAGIFPNNRAVIRLVGALMLEQNDEWSVSRRYMSLESLNSLSDDPVRRLSAVTA